MKSKLIPIPYTVGIVKPHLALRQDKMDEVVKHLEDNHFEIFHQKRKILTKEEVLNLFYSYRNAPFYPEIQEHMLTAESVVLLMINKTESIVDEETEEEIKLESPIVRWKKLLGDKDPAEAKSNAPESLRAMYG